MVRLLTLAHALALAVALPAQRVYVSHGGADTVRQGDAFNVMFGFEDVSAGGFELPELVGLLVVGGPGRQSSVSVVNGVRSSSEAYTYRVVADQTGLAYIPSVTAETADSTYSSEPVRLFVTDDPDYVAPDVAPRRGRPARPVPPVPPRRKRPTVKM